MRELPQLLHKVSVSPADSKSFASTFHPLQSLNDQLLGVFAGLKQQTLIRCAIDHLITQTWGVGGVFADSEAFVFRIGISHGLIP
ncbi:hypothetical protein EMIT0P265_50321 [Pseudomonas zeae]